MGRKSKIEISEPLKELQLRYKKERNFRLKQRLRCLIHTKDKKFKTQYELSTYLGVDYATVKRWLKQYREEGLTSYLSIRSGGNNKSAITKSMHEALAQRLESSSEPFRGYWEVQVWIKTKFKKEIKYNTIRTYLIRHFKTKLKTPRKSHYKKDEQAMEAFFKTSR